MFATGGDRTMIKARLMREDGILVVSPVDTLEAIDLERLRLLVDPCLEEPGELKGLLIDVETFPGWEDFSGMLSHLRFVHDYQQRINRVAAVTDNDILAILPQVADYFAAAEVRHFGYTDRDLALNWLRTGVNLP